MEEVNSQLEPWVPTENKKMVEMELEQEENFQELTKEEEEERIKFAMEMAKEMKKEKQQQTNGEQSSGGQDASMEPGGMLIPYDGSRYITPEVITDGGPKIRSGEEVPP